MAFDGNYSVSQGLDVSSFTITDTSTGSDPNLTGRTVYLYKIDGDLLGQAIAWPIANSTITISSVLDRDYSLNILVSWASSAPIGGSTYEKSGIVTFVGYTNNFIYSIIQQIAANYKIKDDNKFYENLGIVQTEVDNSIQATNYSDQFAAQAALDRAKFYMNKQKLYF